MTCKHENTTVTNSRHHDSLNAYGVKNFSPKVYPFLVGRSRKCHDCGHRFTTVEVTTETMDNITAVVWQSLLGGVKEAIERMQRAAKANDELNKSDEAVKWAIK
jgi:transcriptional regulator NrdR family protein